MAPLSPQSRARRAWALAARQHGVIALFQLLALGYTVDAVRHRVDTSRLHPVHRGVYAVGRADLTKEGKWTAAILACQPHAALSHQSAAALWGIRVQRSGEIHVSVPAETSHERLGITVHRRSSLPDRDVTRHRDIPVTTPVLTLIDLATRLPEKALVAAINKADNLDLVSPPSLREELDTRRGQRGGPALRAILDRATFVLTDSELERLLVPIAARAGLSVPTTQERLGELRVDFYWPDLGLVVETDSLRYHRTAEQQLADRVRDQVHTAAGRTPLRFTHWQVRYDPAHVERTLRLTAHRLAHSGSLTGARPLRAS